MISSSGGPLCTADSRATDSSDRVEREGRITCIVRFVQQATMVESTISSNNSNLLRSIDSGSLVQNHCVSVLSAVSTMLKSYKLSS